MSKKETLPELLERNKRKITSLKQEAYQKGYNDAKRIKYGWYVDMPNRRAMKCEICYSDELGKVSDIENSQKRHDALNDFFIKIQDIVRRETVILFLKCWRRFMK